MKTIGLLGGMAWPSTLAYYIGINKGVEEKFGKDHSAKCLLYSYDFNCLNPTLRTKEEIVKALSFGINKMQDVDILLICSNTMHQYANELIGDLKNKNLLDIREAVVSELHQKTSNICLLLGTIYTMDSGFYKDFLDKELNIKTQVPAADKQKEINRIIFEELINNEVNAAAINFFKDLINTSMADTIILACTELNLVFKLIVTEKTIIDTTQAHIDAAISFLTK